MERELYLIWQICLNRLFKCLTMLLKGKLFSHLWCIVVSHLLLWSHYFVTILAEISSSREVHIWARCKITGTDNFPYSCSCHSFLCFCCKKTDGWLFWPLGDIHNGYSCYIHSLCWSSSLSLSLSLSLSSRFMHNLCLYIIMFYCKKHFSAMLVHVQT